MAETLYRRRKTKKFPDPITSAQLARMVFVLEHCTSPNQPRDRAAYYCGNEDCPVRHFEVDLTHFNRKAPKLKCPHCCRPATALEYLCEVAYEPVD